MEIDGYGQNFIARRELSSFVDSSREPGKKCLEELEERYKANFKKYVEHKLENMSQRDYDIMIEILKGIEFYNKTGYNDVSIDTCVRKSREKDRLSEDELKAIRASIQNIMPVLNYLGYTINFSTSYHIVNQPLKDFMQKYTSY